MLIPVILSGGSGTRLWPLSRELYPKQLLPLVGAGTMLQETLARLAGVPDVGAPLVVCNESHRFLVAEQLLERGAQPQAILLEPVGRNTAPAVAIAAMAAVADAPPGKTHSDPVLLILPADHVIRDVRAFQAAVAVGRKAAEEGKLVTFGVVPTKPETGYGYIRRSAGARAPSFPIAQFVEKPDLATAQRYVESGEYFWNSGMFMFRASSRARRAAQARAGDLRGVRAGVHGGEARSRFHAPARQGVRRVPERLDRLCRHGEDPARRRGAARCRLERRRLLVGAARGDRRRRARQRDGSATC